MPLLMCALWALLYLAVFCLVALVVWLIAGKLLSIFSIGVDPRIWQIIGLIVLLVFAIYVLQTMLAGGCGVRLWPR